MGQRFAHFTVAQHAHLQPRRQRLAHERGQAVHCVALQQVHRLLGRIMAVLHTRRDGLKIFVAQKRRVNFHCAQHLCEHLIRNATRPTNGRHRARGIHYGGLQAHAAAATVQYACHLALHIL